jgi:hypothetical protein
MKLFFRYVISVIGLAVARRNDGLSCDVVRKTHRLLEYLWRRLGYVVELAWKTNWSDIGGRVPIAM